MQSCTHLFPAGTFSLCAGAERDGGDEFETRKRQIFCDLDGVLTDIEALFQRLHPRFDSMDKTLLWQYVDRRGVEFWSKMPWKPDGRQLWQAIRVHEPRILTAAPVRIGTRLWSNSRQGKLQWVRRELGERFGRTAIVCKKSEKADYAAPHRILIDDDSVNTGKWESAGGIAVLHRTTDATLERLQSLLAAN